MKRSSRWLALLAIGSAVIGCGVALSRSPGAPVSGATSPSQVGANSPVALANAANAAVWATTARVRLVVEEAGRLAAEIESTRTKLTAIEQSVASRSTTNANQLAAERLQLSAEATQIAARAAALQKEYTRISKEAAALKAASRSTSSSGGSSGYHDD